MVEILDRHLTSHSAYPLLQPESHSSSAPLSEEQPGGQRSQAFGSPTVSALKISYTHEIPGIQNRSEVQIQSPSTASSHSSPFAGTKSNTSEPLQQRQQPPTSSQRGMASPLTSRSPYPNSHSPDSPPTPSAYPYAESGTAGPTPMFSQRPLPSAFSPANVSGSSSAPSTSLSDVAPTEPSTPNQWQHHHYIAPSASAAFPGQTQDRYVCQVCNKAFSRPSSLRIHSHSHTGEKPFQCPHKGCGKAFSVRSNMKRHERGCHGGGGSPGSSQT